MNSIDVIIIALYLLLTIAIGVYVAKKALIS